MKRIKLFKKSEPINFVEMLEQKDYKLGLELYQILLASVSEFKESGALEEFILRVEEVEKVELYFPKDSSIKRFKKKIRKDYQKQIKLVLEEFGNAANTDVTSLRNSNSNFAILINDKNTNEDD